MSITSGSRLAAYAGLAPTDRRSGRSINTSCQHRGGNHRGKNAMFVAAFVATQHETEHETEVRASYERKRTEGKRHNAAIICVARRRRDLISVMLKTATPYDPEPIRTSRRNSLTTRREHPKPSK